VSLIDFSTDFLVTFPPVFFFMILKKSSKALSDSFSKSLIFF
jgi:hypothetical protein